MCLGGLGCPILSMMQQYLQALEIEIEAAWWFRLFPNFT